MTRRRRLSWFVIATFVVAVPVKGDEPRGFANASEIASLDREFDALKRLFRQRCVACHGEAGTTEGEVDLAVLGDADDLRADPELIADLVDVIDSGYMPPEGEVRLDDETRREVLGTLTRWRRDAAESRRDVVRAPVRRMNRFQYGNAVQDLFQLRVEVFPLPERMLRDHGGYFQPHTGRMPDQLKVGSRPLGKSQMIEPHLGGVTPFPQDLRAEHGFDNRGDHLTLSPLLLESLMGLSRSIVESPDFNAKTCGIWDQLFATPNVDEAERSVVIRDRLRRFLTRAFRRPAEDAVIDRYTEYVSARLAAGEPFADAMRGAAAAAIASPQFFYLYDVGDPHAGEPGDGEPVDPYSLASRLSFFLWGSIPDETLLGLAASGELHQPEVLAGEVERMIRDRRLKRFCDSFPGQWLQLDRIISSTPDPDRFPEFYFAKYRASMHMMLEPLLLFEAVLIEDRSILQFIDADFSYRSDLLSAWYRDGTQGRPGAPTQVSFRRVPIEDRREGGMITNAAVLTMTSGTRHTKPMTRGAWLASVILNDPPPPPPADVPPLSEEPGDEKTPLTLRERFAAHRSNAACMGCHQRIDPLGFALENFDPVGRWRDAYENGRSVDASGSLFGRHRFDEIVEFKDAMLHEKDRFTRALAGHLLSFALGRELGVNDAVALDAIVERTAASGYRFQTLIEEVVRSDPFRR